MICVCYVSRQYSVIFRLTVINPMRYVIKNIIGKMVQLVNIITIQNELSELAI